MSREGDGSSDRTRVGRRPLLLSAGLALTAVSVPGSLAAAAQEETEEESEDDGPSSRPMLGDIDGDRQFSDAMHLEGDPTGQLCGNGGTDDGEDSDRDTVVHVTSEGEPTTDYASSLVSVADQDLTLADVTDGGTLSYDYFEGPDNEKSAPDEVFVVLDVGPENGSGDSTESDMVTIAYNHEDDGREPDPNDVPCADDNKQWLTRDVAEEIASDTGWRSTAVTVEQIESGEMLLPVGITLRDSDQEEETLLETYGGDAPLLAVGIGRGWTTQETVVDTYFDALVVDDVEYDFPVAVSMTADIERTSEGDVEVTLALERAEQGLALDTIAEDTVGLWPFEQVTSLPPTADGAIAESVEVDGDEVTATVDEDAVGDVLDGGQQEVLVSGAFEMEERVVAFAGVGELDLSD